MPLRTILVANVRRNLCGYASILCLSPSFRIMPSTADNPILLFLLFVNNAPSLLVLRFSDHQFALAESGDLGFTTRAVHDSRGHQLATAGIYHDIYP